MTKQAATGTEDAAQAPPPQQHPDLTAAAAAPVYTVVVQKMYTIVVQADTEADALTQASGDIPEGGTTTSTQILRGEHHFS